MALRDVKNFQFFKEAIAQRFRNPDLKSFRGIPYEPQANPQTIFGRIYSTFRELLGKGLNLHQYLNIGERSVLENLYQNLRSDRNLKFLNEPNAILADPRFELSEQYYQEQSPQMAAAQQAEVTPTAAPPVGAPPSLPAMGGIAPAIPRAPRIIVMPQKETVASTANAPFPSASNAPASTPVPTASTAPTPPATPTSPRFNFGALRSRVSSFASPVMNKVASSAGPSIKKGLEGIGRGITGAGRAGLGAATPSLGRIGNGFLNGIQSISQPGGIGGGGVSRLSKSSNRLAIGLVGGLMLFMLIAMMGGTVGTTPTGQAAPLPTTNTNLSSCKFTRTGYSQLVKSSILLAWINASAASVGIPAQVLASVAMHENQDFTANADDNHDAIKSNQFCNKAPVFCEKNGQVLHSIDGKDDPCTTEEIANGARNAQAVGFMQNLDIYNPGKNLCSITESLSIAAAKLKSNGLTSQPTQDQINKAINAYYNSCTYGSYSYCNEVWQDLQNCQPASGTAPTAPGPIGFSLSCPLGSNFTISCGTAANPVNNCGHGGIGYAQECNPTYYVCNGTKYSDALYYAIDVKGSNIVILPFVNGNEPVEWTRVEDQPIPIGGGSWGYRIDYQSIYKGDRLFLDLTHINNQINSAKTLRSGEQVGTVFTDIGHLHMGLSVNDRWVEPIQQVRMCVQ